MARVWNAQEHETRRSRLARSESQQCNDKTPEARAVRRVHRHTHTQQTTYDPGVVEVVPNENAGFVAVVALLPNEKPPVLAAGVVAVVPNENDGVAVDAAGFPLEAVECVSAMQQWNQHHKHTQKLTTKNSSALLHTI